MPIHAEICPTEAVEAARRDAAAGHSDAWDGLDRVLRWHVLRTLSDGHHDTAALSDAFLAAVDWARSEQKRPWVDSWPALFNLLRDAEKAPSLAKGLRSLEGRSAEVLAYLAARHHPVPRMELRNALEVSESQMTNLLRRLEGARLLVRRDGDGRTKWIAATPRGLELGKHLLPSLPRRREAEQVEAQNEDAQPKDAQNGNPQPKASKLPLWIGADEAGADIHIH